MIDFTKFCRRASVFVIFGAGLAAIAEVDTPAVLLIFGVGLVGLLLTTWIIAKEKDEVCAVEVHRHRSPSDSLGESIAVRTNSGALASGIAGFIVFLAFTLMSVLLNSPLPMIGAVVLVLGLGIRYAILNRYTGHETWKEFAIASGLEHDGGDLFDYRKPERIHGSYRGRRIELSVINTSHGSSLASSSGRFAITSNVRDPEMSFCIDNMRIDSRTNSAAKRLLANDALKSRFFTAQPRRISVCDGQLCLHAEVLPITSMELRFFCELICDTAELLESDG